MTNKEDEGDASCEPRLAALLAVHLVSQVLDEAYVIANAAKDSGEPWRYLTMLKNLRGGSEDEDLSFVASKGDSDSVNENKIEHVANVVATSTPQKLTEDTVKSKNETSFIGQGDEEFQHQDDATNSTSTFISHLFDMSEVEKVVCDNTEITQNIIESNELSAGDITKVMESYIDMAVNMAFGQTILTNESQNITEKSSSTEHSDYSFMDDAFGKDLDFFKKMGVYFAEEEIISESETKCEIYEVPPEIPTLSENVETVENIKKYVKNDVAFFENTYLTLNRDDQDQSSEEGGDPVLQDPKSLIMQEVELLTEHSSEEQLPQEIEQEKKAKELTATSAISAASGSRKSSLVQRCRSQGARLLACLRGWWRRKTPGKRKDARMKSGAIRGFCPLSPDARRRAASLLDNSRLRSPSPHRALPWKFNTVNEALVTSSHWKDYTFEVNPDNNEC